MVKIISEQIARIIKSKKRLEKILKIKITNRGKEVTVEGQPQEEYIAQKVIEAINFGFPISAAILIKTEDNMFEILDIKDYTKRKDMKVIKGRLIGTKGKTLRNLTELTGAHIEMQANQIAIIAPPETMQIVQNAVISIIHGAKQAHVYTGLTKNRPEPINDLGLKKKHVSK